MKGNILIRFIVIAVFTIVAHHTSHGQLIDVKDWDGTYPDMEESYPLSFVSFKGWLIPVPHFFVRTYPTHYYIKVGAVPVTDSGELAGKTKTGLLRIVAKAVERSQMKGRYAETEQIKLNTGFQQKIQQKLFDSKNDQLSDIYNLAERFIKLYRKVDRLGSLENSAQIKRILEKEADRLLMQFLMVNLMQTDHGRKLEAFTGINRDLNKLTGEVDYTYSKVDYFNHYSSQLASYSFLTD